MRRPKLSRGRRGGSGRPRKTVAFAPLRLLLSALSLGRLSSDPVHDEVRPDSQALQSRVRFASKGPSSCSQSPKTGRSGRSSSVLVGQLSLTFLSRLLSAWRSSCLASGAPTYLRLLS